MDVCLEAALSPLDFALCLFLWSPFQKIAPELFLEILFFLIFFSSNSWIFSVICCFDYFGLLMKVTLPIVKGG